MAEALPACPLPLTEYPTVQLAHGSGGKLMHRLIQDMFYKTLGNKILFQSHDSACLDLSCQQIALTTDSYVVRPLFFPGGDIGSLAVYGTVNDLAMAAARPLYLTLAFILEEGLSMQDLWKVVHSIAQAAAQCKVQVVTGDTKVVERGKGDGIFINTTGVGALEQNRKISPGEIQAGDAVILSGDPGRHGIAILAEREGLAFESRLESDCAPLWPGVASLLEADLDVHCMRDITRGGLAGVCVELASATGHSIELVEDSIPICREVRSACELLGLDPLHVASEGRFVAIVSPSDSERVVKLLKTFEPSAGAVVIGKVMEQQRSAVTLLNSIGSRRVVDMLSGEQLPRIC